MKEAISQLIWAISDFLSKETVAEISLKEPLENGELDELMGLFEMLIELKYGKEAVPQIKRLFWENFNAS